MARSHESVEGSLELLLDTITNTFGSVLFITMLVAILLRMSSHSAGVREPISKTEQARAEAQAAELSAEIDRLKAILDSLPPGDPALARMESDIATATQATARTLAEDAKAAKEIIANQERLAEIERQAAETEKELKQTKALAEEQETRCDEAEELAAELAKLAVELDRPVDPNRIVQTAQLPELTVTKKTQIGLFMRYGRLYVMHNWDKAGERLGPNADHFVVVTRPDGNQSAKARPDAGHIADGATIKKTVRDILRRFPPDGWVVAVIVNEDSFSQFQAVKAALVDLGYQYEPIIVRADGGIWDSGGSGKRGQ